MSRNFALGLLVGGFASLAGCLDDGGGGGGGGTITFNTGYAFIRDDDVWIADQSDYTEADQLTATGGNKHPSVSADGLQVVYVNVTDGVPSIQAIATSGTGSPRTLHTAESGQSNFRTPVFSPDGSTVVFAFENAGGISQLGAVPADGTSGLTVLTPDTISYASPSFYADGVHVLAMAGTAPHYDRLEKFNIDTGSGSPLVSSLGGNAASIANRVVLSPDETRAAFDGRLVSNDSTIRIFVVDLGGTTDAAQLTDYPGDPTSLDGFPSWVSNSRVAFHSNSGGLDNLYEISATAVETTGSLVVGSAREGWYSP